MKGFTLVEIMISVAIMAGMIVGLFQVFETGRNVYDSNQALMQKQRIVQQVLGGMVRELRQARLSDITINGTNDQIDFVIPVSVDPVTMSSNIEYSINNNQIIRTHPPGAQTVLAVNVDNLTFTLNGNLLEIEIQARVTLKTGDMVFTVQEIINLRS
jgi:prepilin-type N-terminal cleavage/methylation domain-containing protein